MKTMDIDVSELKSRDDMLRIAQEVMIQSFEMNAGESLLVASYFQVDSLGAIYNESGESELRQAAKDIKTTVDSIVDAIITRKYEDEG